MTAADDRVIAMQHEQAAHQRAIAATLTRKAPRATALIAMHEAEARRFEQLATEAPDIFALYDELEARRVH